MLEACLDEIYRQLAAKGLILKTGTLIDATFFAAKSRKPERAAGLGRKFLRARRRLDEEDGRSHFGYRLHAGVDEGSGLIRRLVLTPARVNESLAADDLICGDERAVDGDRLREQGAPCPAQGARHQGSLHAPHRDAKEVVWPARGTTNRPHPRDGRAAVERSISSGACEETARARGDAGTRGSCRPSTAARSVSS